MSNGKILASVLFSLGLACSSAVATEGYSNGGSSGMSGSSGSSMGSSGSVRGDNDNRMGRATRGESGALETGQGGRLGVHSSEISVGDAPAGHPSHQGNSRMRDKD